MIQRIGFLLVIIGAFNWGLIGLFQFDVIAALFGGEEAILSRVVYTLVGIGALISIPLLFEGVMQAADRDEGVESRNARYGTEFSEEINRDREEK